MKRSVFETLLGGAVLAIAIIFFMFSYNTAEVGTSAGYTITADFSSVGGLRVGDDVQISGVKVGSVQNVELDAQTFLAKVTLTIENGLELPTDTAAAISSESLLGGLYMSLTPGADDETIEEGGRIQYTQAPQNLEQLLGQFIFSMQDSKDK